MNSVSPSGSRMPDKNGEHVFLWQIENFSACTQGKTQYLRSPVIRARELDDTYWNIMLAPRGDEDERFISVHLLRSVNDDGPTGVHLELGVCLLDVNGDERFGKSGSFTINLSTSFSTFFSRGDVFEGRDTLLPNDVLTVLIRARKSADRSRIHPSRSVVRTKIRVERSSLLWTIRGFARKKLPNRRVVRIETSVASMELVCEGGSAAQLHFAITPEDRPGVRIFMSVTIRTLDADIDPPAKIESEHVFDAGSASTWFLPSIDIGDRMESLLEGGRLDLACRFSVSDGSQDGQKEGALIALADAFHSDENTLTQDVESAYRSVIDVNPDILLEVYDGSRLFEAHKFILGIRSGVFRDALNRFEAEKKSRIGTDATTTSDAVCVRHEHVTLCEEDGDVCAQVLHTSPRVLAQVLKCMYTDALDPDSVGNAMHLHSAGVRFDFRLLREKSEMYLKSKISVRSLFPILIFAHLKRISRLKCDCLNFVSVNREFLLASSEWDDLRVGHGDLAEEVLDSFASERYNSC